MENLFLRKQNSYVIEVEKLLMKDKSLSETRELSLHYVLIVLAKTIGQNEKVSEDA